MRAVEFTVELTAEGVLRLPPEAAAQLPKAGRARIIVIAADDVRAAEWRSAAYEQFMRDDSPEDAVYDTY